MTLPPFPRMQRVRQRFQVPPAPDLEAQLAQELARLLPSLKPGARIAVGVGSRGISNLQAIVTGVLSFLKSAGTHPFIVPAMGSHGGATPEGQLQLLAEYGITEQALGVPIRASMETRELGRTAAGPGVFFSEEALNSDGVFVINRVKPHTDFQSDTLGSGLIKMLVVGLGKRDGAASYHTHSSRFGYEQVLRDSVRVTLDRAPILGGLAIVENQRHDTARLALVLPAEMESRESELYQQARAWMPRLPFDDIDLLIVDRIGKNISGAGLDPNVIGRSLHGYSALLSDRSARPIVRRIFVREITPESHGNAVGIGLADFATFRLVRSIDHRVTYLNSLTAMSLQSAKIPIHFETDREAIGRALESLALPDTRQAGVLRIQDTLSIEHVEVSELFARAFPQRSDLEPVGQAGPMTFDEAGNLPASQPESTGH